MWVTHFVIKGAFCKNAGSIQRVIPCNNTIYSGAQCDGAIYAKKISVENGVSFSSSDIDPEGDPDHDGVANLLEALTGTDPLDPNSFKMMLLPNPVAINNTTSAVIKYDATHFYSEFPSSDSICLTLPAGTLATGKRTVLMNVNNAAVNFSGNSISGFSLPAGYSTISRFLSLEPDAFAAHKNMTITIPLSLDGYLESENYAMMYHTAGSSIWSIADVTIADLSDNTIGITATVQSPEALIIVSKKNAKITGYMDGGLVITGENAAVASIAFDLEIQDIPQSSTAAVSVDYYEMQSGTASELKTVTVNFINMEDGNGGYKLVANTVNNPFTTANTVTLSQIRITGAGVNYTCETSNTILQGQKLLLSAHCVPLYYNSSVSSVAWTYSNNFNLEAIDLNGEGRIRKVGHAFTYDYYVKDHLGSTREVISDEGKVTEATMYYPYGTMEALMKPPTDDKAREKFTGKELDSGDNPASEVSFNIAINNFDAGLHYHGELYVNYTDLVYNRSFLKVYPLQYDADADRFILNTADRFPDSMRVTNLRISTSGAVSPINYEKACDYTVITDSGLAITLDTSGSALINSSSVNYFTDSPYTPERVAGSNLYYFGARYYDAELGVWGSTDIAGQYGNTYSYCGGTPTIYRDNDGLIAVYVNGISGEDDVDLRRWIRAHYGDEYGGTFEGSKPAARWGKNYDSNVLKNMLKVGTIIGAMCEGYEVYSNTLIQAYYDLQPGDKLHVLGYSGGAASSGFASAMLNTQFGYGSVSDRVTYKGVDWLGFGTTFSGVTGTPTTHYYELGDPLSWVGSGMGELAIPAVAPFIDAVLPGISGIAAFMMMGDLSPNAVIADPASATDIMDPDKWFIGGDHSNTSDIKNGYTVLDYANDSWYKWAGIETAAIGSPAPTVLATYATFGANTLISKATHWLTGLFH